MDASPEFCLLPSIDARAVFFSFVGLGLVTPISPFLCVIGWIWCFSVYLTSTWLFLFSPIFLSLHDDCVISFFLSNTHTHIQLSFIKFFLPVSSLFLSNTRSNHPYLIHSFPLTPILSNFHIHPPIPTSSFLLLQKTPKPRTMHFPHFHRLAAPVLLLLLQFQLHPLFTTASSSTIDHTHDSDKTLFHFVTVSKKKHLSPHNTK